jgi:hypothetical protein
MDIIQRTIRNFASLKTLSFLSLKLEVMSFECIKWVLISLKNDEMTPSVKAIQSRIKEAFALKVYPDIWNEFIAQISDEGNHKF